jgi:hypothetical protein
MEDDHSRVQRSTSSYNLPHTLTQTGRKFASTSTSAHDRSIDHEDPPILARKSSISSPQGTAARKIAPSPRPQPVFRSKGVRPNVSGAQNTSMGPPATKNVHQSAGSNTLRRDSAELNSSQRSQHTGSQASSLVFRAYSKFKY